MKSDCDTWERQTPCARETVRVSEHRTEDRFSCPPPWRPLGRCPGANGQLSAQAGQAQRRTSPALSPPAAEAVFFIYLLVSVSGWPVRFFSISRPLSLNLKHYPDKITLSRTVKFLSSLPYMKHMFTVLKDPLNGRAAWKPTHAHQLMRFNPVLNQYLWTYCFFVML